MLHEISLSPIERTEGPDWVLEVGFRPGVTDNEAKTARETILLVLGLSGAAAKAVSVYTSVQHLLFSAAGQPLDEKTVLHIARDLLANELIQRFELKSAAQWAAEPGFAAKAARVTGQASDEVAVVPLTTMTDAELVAFSRANTLALSLGEMKTIVAYYKDPAVRAARKAAGLSPAQAENPTDAEVEVLAQTWSEHCKHKIFNADISYEEEGQPTQLIRSLYKSYIRKTTEDLAPSKPFLRSVFVDNAGVVQFFEGSVLCVKAETHNSPSALDPYGGAITGIVGVNRDILGTGMGAKPIFNTNVLCFGYPDTPEAELPAGLIHPRDVLEGVHRGIVDGGNQSGIPVAAGAFAFDESYRGKPLVFCGTGGIMPERVNGEPSWEKTTRPGALAVMLGGRIGKDGIHGATFSSLALDESSPVSAVQIGDPIIQRRMTDFLLEARDLGLYESITDNGAGGLSSSLGEMAEASGGVLIDLDACPLKYPGLSPWEILVSESQERMSLAVAPEKIDEFNALAARRDVEASVVGRFTDSGFIELKANGRLAGLLSLEFLHRGLPLMRIPARWQAPVRRDDSLPAEPDHTQALLDILADPNVASKESLIRQYDHEVQARSVEKPCTGIGRDAPSDGGVLRVDYSGYEAITVSHGLCPRYSDYDTQRMARMAVDEAYRAHIALGGDPERAAALDNFCWPDPVESDTTPDGAYKAAQLVRACMGLREACLAYGLPLVSGKDSMKNDARVGGRTISVRPTLLVTLMGAMKDLRKAVSTDFLNAGEFVYILGSTNGELGCTMYERTRGRLAAKAGSALAAPEYGEAPDVDQDQALRLYRALARAISGRIVRACHDCSDGGAAVALAESCLGGRVGLKAELGGLPGRWPFASLTAEAALPPGAGGADSSGGHESARELLPPRDLIAQAARALFSESGGRFVVSIRREDRERFEETLTGLPLRWIGETTEDPSFILSIKGTRVVDCDLTRIERAFKSPIA
ncbi:MAG TPA: phosphoribosylformylglycinamidine synthase [Spirochaetaceae bacterium]|nr:phosphoribosylformylglycinamidine synthase [Spirochaetaceae bacterium]